MPKCVWWLNDIFYLGINEVVRCVRANDASDLDVSSESLEAFTCAFVLIRQSFSSFFVSIILAMLHKQSLTMIMSDLSLFSSQHFSPGFWCMRLICVSTSLKWLIIDRVSNHRNLPCASRTNRFCCASYIVNVGDRHKIQRPLLIGYLDQFENVETLKAQLDQAEKALLRSCTS